MTNPRNNQKEEAFAFALAHGFTIGSETRERRTYYHAIRSTGRVDAQGYASLATRMRRHLEEIGEIPVKVFPKVFSRGAQAAARSRDMPKHVTPVLGWKTPESVTPAQAEQIVKTFREQHPEISLTWMQQHQHAEAVMKDTLAGVLGKAESYFLIDDEVAATTLGKWQVSGKGFVHPFAFGTRADALKYVRRHYAGNRHVTIERRG